MLKLFQISEKIEKTTKKVKIARKRSSPQPKGIWGGGIFKQSLFICDNWAWLSFPKGTGLVPASKAAKREFKEWQPWLAQGPLGSQAVKEQPGWNKNGL